MNTNEHTDAVQTVENEVLAKAHSYLTALFRQQKIDISSAVLWQMITMNKNDAIMLSNYSESIIDLSKKFKAIAMDLIHDGTAPKGKVWKTDSEGNRMLVDDSDHTASQKSRQQSNKKYHKRKKARNGR